MKRYYSMVDGAVRTHAEKLTKYNGLHVQAKTTLSTNRPTNLCYTTLYLCKSEKFPDILRSSIPDVMPYDAAMSRQGRYVKLVGEACIKQSRSHQAISTDLSEVARFILRPVTSEATLV